MSPNASAPLLLDLVYRSSVLSNGDANFPSVSWGKPLMLGSGLAAAGDQNSDGFLDMLAGIPGAGDVGEGVVRWLELSSGPGTQGPRVRARGATASIGVAQLGSSILQTDAFFGASLALLQEGPGSSPGYALVMAGLPLYTDSASNGTNAGGVLCVGYDPLNFYGTSVQAVRMIPENGTLGMMSVPRQSRLGASVDVLPLGSLLPNGAAMVLVGAPNAPMDGLQPVSSTQHAAQIEAERRQIGGNRAATSVGAVAVLAFDRSFATGRIMCASNATLQGLTRNAVADEPGNYFGAAVAVISSVG